MGTVPTTCGLGWGGLGRMGQWGSWPRGARHRMGRLGVGGRAPAGPECPGGPGPPQCARPGHTTRVSASLNVKNRQRPGPAPAGRAAEGTAGRRTALLPSSDVFVRAPGGAACGPARLSRLECNSFQV